jgi:hypothetical protein
VRIGLIATAAVFASIGILITTGPSSPRPSRASSAASAFTLIDVHWPAGASFQPVGTNPQGSHNLTCASAHVCFLEVSSIPGVPNTLYRTADGGRVWRQLDLPNGVLLNTSVSCSDTLHCMVGAEESPFAKVGTQQIVLVTTDSGGRWIPRTVTIPSVPGPDVALNSQITGTQGLLQELRCFNAMSCVAFGVTPTGLAEGGSDGQSFVQLTVAMRTDDAGVTWSTHVFPWSNTPIGTQGWSNEEHATFSCPTLQQCIGLATVLAAPDLSPSSRANGTYGNQETSTLQLSTRDGGKTWSQSWPLPAAGEVAVQPSPVPRHAFA